MKWRERSDEIYPVLYILKNT